MTQTTAAPGAAVGAADTPPDRPHGPALGTPAARHEGRDKVTGAARYAAEHRPPDGMPRAWARVVPATVARGRVVRVDTGAALDHTGVLDVLTPWNAPRIAAPGDPTLAVLQDDRVPHRGWPVALVVAESEEAARAGAEAVHVVYETEPFDVTLTEDDPAAYVPEEANGGHPGRRERGDPDRALREAPFAVDVRYRMLSEHNHPMEPHASLAEWQGDRLTVHDTSQGSSLVAGALAGLFKLPEDRVTVHSEHVGGGFGSKGTPRPQVVLAALAARHTGRPVVLAMPRRRMPALVGHRAPMLQRVRLGADNSGRLTSVVHEVTTHTSRIKEFTEQAAVPARVMYGSPHSRTEHRVVPLDVPTPSWMRAPGEMPGMYALESAMDELAQELDMDPVELRIRNEPEREPDSGRPFSSRHLVECLREGAERFGWAERDPRPGTRHRNGRLTGTGVAAATYPVLRMASHAAAHAHADGTYTIRVNATDIGTGARTVLAQVAADALGVPLETVRCEVGSSALPAGSVAGGSSGTASWGSAVHAACTALATRLEGHTGPLPSHGLGVEADTTEAAAHGSAWARHAFGAHFAETEVDTVTGEIRVTRLLGVFAAGHVLNPRTARSQFVGGMTMGLGSALMEGAVMEPAFGDFTESDLATYHVPTHADVPEVEAHWIDEDDVHLNPMGSKGIGEIGIVGTAAAIGNAVHHATGARLRELPLTPDRVLAALAT